MALSDDELLDFDLMNLGGFDFAPRKLLRDHGEVYRSHLVIARFLDEWRNGIEAGAGLPTSDARFVAGEVAVLRDCAVHLRQGDFVPGGALYKQQGGPAA